MKTKISQFLTVLFLVAVFAVSANATGKDLENQASSHESIEELLEIENWMVNDFIWDSPRIDALETVSVIENWMTNQSIWEVNAESFVIEDWMLDDSIWEVKDVKETETSLAIENWMVNSKVWAI